MISKGRSGNTSHLENSRHGLLSLDAATISGFQACQSTFHGGDSRGGDNRGEEIRVWPLQLVFSAGLWHLAWEDDAIGRPHGLLQSERLERLVFLQAEPRGRRNESEHSTALARLQRLLHHCGGIELGDDLTAQEGLCQPSSEQRRRQLQSLRLSCKAAAFASIRVRAASATAGAHSSRAPAWVA